MSSPESQDLILTVSTWPSWGPAQPLPLVSEGLELAGQEMHDASVPELPFAQRASPWHPAPPELRMGRYYNSGWKLQLTLTVAEGGAEQ